MLQEWTQCNGVHHQSAVYAHRHPLLSSGCLIADLKKFEEVMSTLGTKERQIERNGLEFIVGRAMATT